MVEYTLQQWQESEGRAEALSPAQRPAVERVTDELVAGLRRRLGSRFTVAELAELYDRGTDWALEEAYTIAPGAPWAWDPRVTVDAAFWRYVHEAADFAGGRVIVPDV